MTVVANRLSVEERQSLVSVPRTMRLARVLAAQHSRSRPWLADDFLGAAYAGLATAATTFDPAKRIKFTTYAYHKILWAIQQCGEREVRHKRACVTIDEIGDVPDWREEDESWTDVDLCAALRRLPGRDREILTLRYRDDLTFREIVEGLGVTKQRVEQIHNRSIRSLRESFSRPTEVSSHVHG